MVHSEWRLPIFIVHPIMMENQPWQIGGNLYSMVETAFCSSTSPNKGELNFLMQDNIE
jgi:hypothetical protein